MKSRFTVQTHVQNTHILNTHALKYTFYTPLQVDKTVSHQQKCPSEIHLVKTGLPSILVQQTGL